MIAWWLLACRPPEVVPPVDAGEAGLVRRLTPLQVQNTVDDLFPGVILPRIDLVGDGEVFGFDNNRTAQEPSRLYVEQVQEGARQVVDAALGTPGPWLPCDLHGGSDPRGCAEATLADLGPRIVRRPWTLDDRDVFLGLFDEVALEAAFDVALGITLEALLQDPEFLYLPEIGRPDPQTGALVLTPHELAARLSYFLWNTLPDTVGFGAAESGRLDDVSGIEAEAWRMLDHPRARDAASAFHAQWLDLDHIDVAVPDRETFPDFTPGIPALMRDEIDAHIQAVVFDGDATLSALLLDRQTAAAPQLADLYGIGPQSGELPADERAGLLTRAGWLLATSNPVHPSPVQRGVFVLDRMLCSPVPAPPADVNTNVDVDVVTGTTNRDRYAAHVADPGCAVCHDAIDPIGFGFEHYDAVGAYRRSDSGVAVDASGTFVTGDLDGVSFVDAVGLSEHLAGSKTVHDCVARQWMRYAHRRMITAEDDDHVAAVEAEFWATGDLRQLMVDIAISDAFRAVR